ncbi:MAG TPA: hypothetical protein VFZ05_03175 [Nitrososphaera sp.]
MPEKGEVVGKRYKIQTKDRFEKWVDFGPFFFNTQETMAKYLDEYKRTLGKARIVEVIETVIKYVN